jgi:prepilin-type N-terminal cleavage/methylation domain-containing protein
VSEKGLMDNRRYNHNGPEKLTGEEGFTLVEVMIASVIMAFVLVSTMAVVSHASVYLADLRLRVSSSQILQQRVEDLRAMNWAQLSTCPSIFTNGADTTGTFSGFVIISSYQTFSGADTVMKATVTVTWTNRHSHMVSNQLTTLISNGGINKTVL